MKMSDTYARAFGEYVTLAKRKDALMADMNQKASAALEITTGIRDTQKAKYNALMEESETKTFQMRHRVVYADGIKDHFLQAKGYRVVMSAAKTVNISMMTEWKGHHDFIKRSLEKMAPFMVEPISKERHANVISAQNEVIEKGVLFF